MAFTRLNLLLSSSIVLILVSLTGSYGIQSDGGCVKHIFSTGKFDIACRCNLTYCDTIDFVWPKDNEILFVTTDRNGQRFATKTIKMMLDGQPQEDAFKDDDYEQHQSKLTNNNKLTLELNLDNKKQKILGFGGAFTDATSLHLQSMKAEMRKSILEQYFAKHGLRYTMSRVTIAGADFSVRAYSYDDIPTNQSDDFNLKQFKLQKEDLQYKIPSILEAKNILKEASGGKQELRLFGSSWSSPAWMKDNLSLVRGHLKGNSSGLYYDALARYLVRFLKEYQTHDINFWGLTSQNEPAAAHSAGYNFNSLIFEPDQLNAFVRDNLGPTLEKNGFGKDKLNLIIYDDNLASMMDYANKFAHDEQTMKYVAYVGLHWYTHNSVSYSRLDQITKMLPSSKHILSTEACHEGGTKPGNWDRGAEYAYDIIQTLSHGVVGWIEWNYVLDMIGGPNWVKNYVDAPMLLEGETYYKNPMYYVLAHFTRFLEPQSQVFESKLLSATNNNYHSYDRDNIGDIYVIAAERPNKKHYSVVILNKGLQDKFIDIKLNKQTILLNLSIKSNSVTTVAVPNTKVVSDYVDDIAC